MDNLPNLQFTRKRFAAAARRFLTIVLLIIPFAGTTGDLLDRSDAPLVAVAELHDADGRTIGTVHFHARDDATIVVADMQGLEPGYHGFHVHEIANCDAQAENGPFTSAGGHYHVHDSVHGTHHGDLPALYANRDGRASMVVLIDRFTPATLLRDHTAVVVHAEPDNFGHIPQRYQSDQHDQPGPDAASLATGDAGARVACGVIRAPADET